MKVFLLNKIIKSSLSDEAVAVYIALRSIFITSKELYFVCVDSIYFSLAGDMKPSRDTAEQIMCGILELQMKGYVQILKQKGGSYILDLSNIRSFSVLRRALII
jgi:hypothetical protein